MNPRGVMALTVLGLGYGTGVLRLPVHGWRPTTTEDGIGPLTVRHYWLDVSGMPLSRAETVQTALQSLPDLFPPALAVFRRVRPGPEATRPGDLFTVLMSGVRRGRVRVAEVTPEHFVLQTLRQHSESGTLEFRVDPLPDGDRLSVVSRMRSSSWFDRAAYLTGVGIVQRMTWETGLRRVQARVGGRKMAHGTSTQEWP